MSEHSTGAVDTGVLAARRSFDLFPGTGHTTSARTVAVAFVVNVLVAVAKTVAAALTASASMLAEAAHSWADTGSILFDVVHSTV